MELKQDGDTKMFIISRQCKLCGNGSLGIRVCSGNDRHLLILCDECGIAWLHPDLKSEPVYLGAVPSPGSHWATEAEIRRFGWWDYVVGAIPSPEERLQLLQRLRHINKHKSGTKPFFNLSVCEA